MSSIQNAPQLLAPLAPHSSGVARLDGTLWARSIVARAFYLGIQSLARALARLGISADAVTYASLVLALFSGVAVAMRHPGLGASLILLSASLDLVDGALARTSGTASRWGALLDSTFDRIADAAPLGGVVIYYADRPWAAAAPLLAVVAGFVISYARARAEALGAQLPSLFMRRAERVILVAASLALGAVSLDGTVQSPLMLAAVAVLAILNVAGAVSILSAARAVLNSDAD